MDPECQNSGVHAPTVSGGMEICSIRDPVRPSPAPGPPPTTPSARRRPGAPSPAAPAAAEPSVLLSDSLMIFKALCKLSQKRVVDPANNLDSQDQAGLRGRADPPPRGAWSTYP